MAANSPLTGPLTPTLLFWGHACFGVHLRQNPWLLIDPYDPAGLGKTPGPPAVPVHYPYTTATHAHADHAAFHTQPNATVLHAPYHDPTDPIILSSYRVFHDEFGGRLRGGTTCMLDLRIGNVRIIHAGDIGERLIGDALTWLQSPRPDVLILPAGGYYTLGADGASALATAVNPRTVMFCHTRDDGLALPELAGRDIIRKRVGDWPQEQHTQWVIPTDTKKDDTPVPTVIWLNRPAVR